MLKASSAKEKGQKVKGRETEDGYKVYAHQEREPIKSFTSITSTSNKQSGCNSHALGTHVNNLATRHFTFTPHPQS
jgi:hypothetical protein